VNGNVFLVSFLLSSLLACRQTSDFCMLIVYLSVLYWNLSGHLHVGSCHLQTENLASSFPIYITFISFSCFVALDKIVLNNWGKYTSCLILNFRGNSAFHH
jgi:hypothetical protein